MPPGKNRPKPGAEALQRVKALEEVTEIHHERIYELTTEAFGRLDALEAIAGLPDTPVIIPPDTDTPEPPPPADLFSLPDQRAVRSLMADTAVHLAVKRKAKGFPDGYWEIRHRNTANGKPSGPIRHVTIEGAWNLYMLHRFDVGPMGSLDGLSPDQQQAALMAFRNASPKDRARSIRWEATKTEVDYIDNNGDHRGGAMDDLEWEPGSLIEPLTWIAEELG